MDKSIIYTPIAASGERVWRTYLGGKNLDVLEGKREGSIGHFPELWVLSAIQAKNVGREEILEGLSKVDVSGERITLADMIRQFPQEMLGKEYARKFNNMGAISGEKLCSDTSEIKA